MVSRPPEVVEVQSGAESEIDQIPWQTTAIFEETVPGVGSIFLELDHVHACKGKSHNVQITSSTCNYALRNPQAILP